MESLPETKKDRRKGSESQGLKPETHKKSKGKQTTEAQLTHEPFPGRRSRLCTQLSMFTSRAAPGRIGSAVSHAVDPVPRIPAAAFLSPPLWFFGLFSTLREEQDVGADNLSLLTGNA